MLFFLALRHLFWCRTDGRSIVFNVLLIPNPEQGSGLIFPTRLMFGTNFLSWLHEHIIWLLFFLILHLINQCMLMNFYHSL